MAMASQMRFRFPMEPQTNTLSLYRSDLDATGLPVGLNANSNNGTNIVSGTSYLGIPANASPINLVFSKGLSALGLTGGARPHFASIR